MRQSTSEEKKQESADEVDTVPSPQDSSKQADLESKQERNILTPPEVTRYQREYGDTERKIEQYLQTKYKQQIESFDFFPRDILVRFVFGYKHMEEWYDYEERLAETEKWFAKYLQFHQDANYDHLLSTLSEKDITELAPATFIYGHDKYGHPVLWDDGRRYRKGGDLSIFKEKQTGNGDEGMMDKFVCFVVRKLHGIKIENTTKFGLENSAIGIYQHCAVIDMNGFSVTKALYERKLNEYMSRRGAEVSPEMLHKMYFINVPWMFVKAWNMLKTWISPITVEKTVILGSDYLHELCKDIDMEMIPKEYGGTGKWHIKYGDVASEVHEEKIISH
eukprot:CAMPEP_0197023336 /NCGR_PEP_ID=MMETSP1384-20130603/4050_1 /TAXON_ID=29189 /ORGANISM="Ammonia sp." /LENGTH=333 /DNA_ID=CAMNT_0042451533 /DNA_START=25 /DNA_END=1026 /DNA_ORIENTATION=+